MRLNVDLGENSYEILIKKGCLNQASSELNLNRKILVISDSGIPAQYIETIAEQCENYLVEIIPQGENNKNIEQFTNLCHVLIRNNFTRTDAIIGLGGGVVGDLAGFVAASYMRGIDFYNIPTTLLSQIDSSVGGKTAINMQQVKNIVGAFYQPKKVLIDPDVLTTLPERQKASGIAEAIKMAATSNSDFFDFLMYQDAWQNIEKVIAESLKIKISVVEQDEREAGLRQVLNFGHTIGHAIEANCSDNYYHGECIALGMLYFSGGQVKQTLIKVLQKYCLPIEVALDPELIFRSILHDKKADGNQITIVSVPEIGSYELNKISISDLKTLLVNR
ncbi:MAG TPA: 3-dehydroquinate synthase [Clostridiaceae bacterium]|nr:3-dehydroquinate synthase [Clostridiaceae bacterium]